jgi:hypothetical protein
MRKICSCLVGYAELGADRPSVQLAASARQVTMIMDISSIGTEGAGSLFLCYRDRISILPESRSPLATRLEFRPSVLKQGLQNLLTAS